jgi:hypothetical protein
MSVTATARPSEASSTASSITDSVVTLGDDTLCFLHSGPGQCFRGGPAACVVSTSVLIHGQDKLSPHGVTFCDPAQSLCSINHAAMFIDDNTSASNKVVRWLHQQPEASQVVALLQQDAQVWECLLFTSGCLLNLRK